MFRRYDIQDGKDIQRAGKTMEKWIAAEEGREHGNGYRLGCERFIE